MPLKRCGFACDKHDFIGSEASKINEIMQLRSENIKTGPLPPLCGCVGRANYKNHNYLRANRRSKKRLFVLAAFERRRHPH